MLCICQSVIPAMLAVKKQIIEPETKARKANSVIMCLFSGAIELRVAIIIPIEHGLAYPQMAYVAIAALRSCVEEWN